jgi:hypothetical protein
MKTTASVTILVCSRRLPAAAGSPERRLGVCRQPIDMDQPVKKKGVPGYAWAASPSTCDSFHSFCYD